MKKRLIIYLASLFACLIASCSEKEETANGGGEPQSYIPFAISKGVNISNWLSQSDVRGEERKNYFTEAEVQQLAGFGFDHIRRQTRNNCSPKTGKRFRKPSNCCTTLSNGVRRQT